MRWYEPLLVPGVLHTAEYAEEARKSLEAAVEVVRLSGFAFLLTWHLGVLGTLERVEGNLDAAHRCAEEALEVARQLGSGWMQANAERLLGRLARMRRDRFSATDLGAVQRIPDPALVRCLGLEPAEHHGAGAGQHQCPV